MGIGNKSNTKYISLIVLDKDESIYDDALKEEIESGYLRINLSSEVLPQLL